MFPLSDKQTSRQITAGNKWRCGQLTCLPVLVEDAFTSSTERPSSAATAYTAAVYKHSNNLPFVKMYFFRSHKPDVLDIIKSISMLKKRKRGKRRWIKKRKKEKRKSESSEGRSSLLYRGVTGRNLDLVVSLRRT
jgi:hypothetical protein